MNKRIFIPAFVLIIVLSGFRGAELYFSVPDNWPKPVYDFKKNPLNADIIELGRSLFYDPLLSKNNSISCASCHSPYAAFTHVDHPLSHGIGDSIGKRNSPALMNLAWENKFMWDGAINHLDMQALAPITNEDEMGETIQNVVSKLSGRKNYRAMFAGAFGDSAITGERTLKAISQFMLTLVSSNSRYDSIMRETAEFTAKEANGYSLFKKNCASCHTEPFFTNHEFANNGLAPDTILNDAGRYALTKKPSDSLKFKVPTLRNIEFTYPYMHDGRYKRLRDVIGHYTSSKYQSSTLALQLKEPVQLNEHEKVDLIAFLLTLSDKSFLLDERHLYPKKNLTRAKEMK